MLDIRKLIDKIEETVESHKLEKTGMYARWLWQNEKNNRKLGINEYGCADAANILYTIGRFPKTTQDREDWISALKGLQNTDTGLFTEATHHPIHTTAHCVAALELFDAVPDYPLTDLLCYKEKEKLYELLENLDWESNSWPESHKGAGIFASLVLTNEASSEWQDWYFEWLWGEADPETGLWRKGVVKPVGTGSGSMLFRHMAGSFHYLFNHEYAKRPLRYPKQMIDTCLAIYERDYWKPLGKEVSFPEIDWVYCIERSLRQSGYKYTECKNALKSFADSYIAYLENIDYKTHDEFNDLHCLFGGVCALAELQQALPGYIKTEKPLKLVLDRRPFI